MYEKITLKNGVRMMIEEIPYVRSVSVGIWVGVGSRYEKAYENGASHFIEHMVFKGTQTRSASEIASLMDSIGGQINAYTTKECTCFYGRVLDTHLFRLTDILCDMFFNSKFDESDIINERSVVYEEIDMYNDIPDDLVMERLSGKLYKGSPLARPILGTKRTLAAMDGTFLKNFMAQHYTAENVVIAIAGSFKENDIEELKKRFEAIPSLRPNKYAPAKYIPSFTVKRKKIEQNHIAIAFPGIVAGHDDKFALAVAANILGGGMSSRLFQSVREKLGLCYSISTFGSSYLDCGSNGIYTALNPESEERAIKVIMDELHKIKDDGVTDEELFGACEQAKANILMGLESTGSRMNRLGRDELMLGKVPTFDELIEVYDSVTKEDVARVIRDYYDEDYISLSAVGKVRTAEEYAQMLK